MVDRVAIVLLACGLVLQVTGASASAAAGSAALELGPTINWDAPEECPATDLTERIAGLVGLAPERLGAKLMRLDATIGRKANGAWTARLQVHTVAGSGERVFEAEDCHSLVEGTALIAALAIDPSVQPKPAAAPVLSSHEAEGAKAGMARARYVLRPQVVGDLGILPDLDIGYGLAAGVVWSWLRLEVDAGVDSAQGIADSSGRGGTIRTPLRAGARACVAPWSGMLEVAGCVGADTAWLRSTGRNIASPETKDSLWVAISAGTAAALRLRDWLWLRVEGHVGPAVQRPVFQVTGVGEIYRPSKLAGRLGAGVELRF